MARSGEDSELGELNVLVPAGGTVSEWELQRDPMCSKRRVVSAVATALLFGFVAACGSNVHPGTASPYGAPVVMEESLDSNLVMFVDAGSSGSKLYVFDGPTGIKKVKFYTECNKEHQQDGHGLKGIASLSYDKADCDWQAGVDDKNLNALPERADYGKMMLKLLADMGDVSQVKNKDAIPVLATAGMRLVSQEANSIVWESICGKSVAGITVAPFGADCGTLTGTSEAYYEFLANAAVGDHPKLTGTFTVGGASAQISIPLRTEQDVAAFKELKSRIKDRIDCTKLQLPNGDTAPVFNTVLEGELEKQCIDDYITFKDKRDIKVSSDVAKSLRLSEIQGVGLISFLGLHGRGTFLAGGLDEMASWAKESGCDADDSDFIDCKNKLLAALKADVMFGEVSDYFDAHFLDMHAFSFNTPAAIPSMAGIDRVDGKNQAWELNQGVTDLCKDDPGARFGYKDSNTCVRAFYTALYTTAFFDRKQTDAEHDKKELFFDAARGWSEGKYEEANARRLAGSHAASWLKLLRWGRFSYADGHALAVRT